MIRNIWCVGSNYLEHAKELHSHVGKEPLIFLKAGSCFVAPGHPIELPNFSHQVHYEVELALQFNEQLKLDEVTVALDLTARDVQNQAKSKGLPWTLAKSFKKSCPVGNFLSLSNLEDAETLSFSLKVNGVQKQEGNASDMIFSCTELYEYVTQHFPVCPGDLLLTGTPVGVSTVQKGDLLQVFLGEKEVGRWKVQ